MLARPAALAAALALAMLLPGCTLPGAVQGDRTGPGQRAADYLRSSPYSRILIELDIASGTGPESAALSMLQSRLQEATGKGVDVDRSGSFAGQGSGHKYTLAEVNDLETRQRSQFSGGTTAILYMLWLDGGFEKDTENQKTLGAAYRGSSVVMFQANLQVASNGGSVLHTKPDITAVEESVLVHESGHILGLVGCGTAMVRNHQDTNPDHGTCHSTDQASVMYWAVETDLIGSLLGQNPPNAYDSDDKADLRAARG